MAEVSRRYTSPHLALPRTQLLSNGHYSVMLTSAGSGYSRANELMVSRWHEDPTSDCWGSYIFLRDVRDGQCWSAGYQPVGSEPESYEVNFYEDRAHFLRKDGPILTELEVCIAGDESLELRRVSLTNQARTVREIELTSYAEMVLAPAGMDAAHPAFAKMFIQTEYVADGSVLLATRRPRDAGETPLWAAHFMTLDGAAVGGIQFETDRARFLGRGHELRAAVSIIEARPLSGTTGTVLDPVLSLRRRVRIEPGQTLRVSFWTAATTSRQAALALAAKYRDAEAPARAFKGAKTQADALLGQLGIGVEDAQLCQEIANRLLYSDPRLRAPRASLSANDCGPRELWAHGLSGERPLVLLRITCAGDLRQVAQLLRAQEYLRRKGLSADLAILNEVRGDEQIQAALETSIVAYKARLGDHAHGAVALIAAAQLEARGSGALAAAARVILGAGEQSANALRAVDFAPRRRRRRENLDGAARAETARAGAALEFFNGIGGFSADGREYVIALGEGQWTPAPWVNVIANPNFGFLASADGSGSTWYRNAQQNPLTPWCNDAVSNTPSEALYIRDEKNGDLWSATPLPVREPYLSYVVRHGFGYTRSEHVSHGIALDLLQFVPLSDSVKISRLKISNRSGEPRRLSITHYTDWVLGNQRSRSPYIVTSREAATGALLARNPWSLDFADQVVFLDACGAQQTVTGDRCEFLGRHGSQAEPVALLGLEQLSNTVGGGYDPCGATQTVVDLKPDETREITLLLGAERSEAAVRALIEKYRAANLESVFREVTDFWERTLGVVQVKTPDRSMDLMLNGWLLYQVIASRLWGRTGFYQSSGAYGYRDQLQDVMSLCLAAPQETRAHILRAAARQFPEGDVQHWWLPTTGQGIKTRIIDDRVWLPFVVARYVEVSGDVGVLDEAVPYLSGPPLAAGQPERFDAPTAASADALYRHCERALDSSLGIGSHGLPLFGTGDWNDGMNRVGALGRGESVWMGWFLHAALMRFAPLAEQRGQADKASEWRKHAHSIVQAIEREAWDGDWYRRGYFDDGTPLGSVSSDECRIDSVAQSWAVISEGAPRGRAVQAMAAVYAQLVSRSDGLIKLFTPPFDRTAHDPGYIKAYPPGLRENGGQYTHAAVWNALACALLKQGERAFELFSLLNPVNHSSSGAAIHRYKVEPYVICADIYAAPGHVGRGGWTWYTGSAGWMYRTGVEAILGVRLRADRLLIEPCIPKSWNGFEFTLKFGSSRYRIEVDNREASGSKLKMSLDGKELDLNGEGAEIALVDDGRYHYGKLHLGRTTP